MKITGITVSGINFISVLQCDVEKKLDCHFSTFAAGYVNDEELKNVSQIERISVYGTLEDKTSVLLFQGLVTSCEIEYSGDTKLVKINALSPTILLDTDVHFRTFQGSKQTYRNIVDEVLKTSERIGMIFTAEKTEVAGRIVVQYEESNWAFFKRLAKELGTILLADCNNTFPCFYFGMPKRHKVHQVELLSLKSETFQTTDGWKKEYMLQSGDWVAIGELVSIEGRNWRVIQSSMCYMQGELLFCYQLEPENHRRKPVDRKNSKVKGVSIPGTVKEVKNAMVKIDLASELDQDFGDGLWYGYATIYSAPDGTGWYCMPEIGEEVRLYFPDTLESNAYVISAVHKCEGSFRADPDKKSFRTKYNKELCFSPNEIFLTNHEGTSIRLHDEKGIIIKSNHGITIQSEASIELQGRERLSMQAKDGVAIQQNANILLIQNGIHEKGRNIDHI